MPEWVAWVVGIVGGAVLGLAWLAAISVLLRERKKSTLSEPADAPRPVTEEAEFEPIRSYLDPDENEPHTPLPSTSMAPLSLSRYVEVRGAIEGWTHAGEDVDAQLSEVFGLNRAGYEEAHLWWMMALADAEDRLDDVDRQVAVFASRYGGAV